MSNCKVALVVLAVLHCLSYLHVSQLFSSFSVVTYFPLMMIYRDLLHATERAKIVLKVRFGGKVQMNCVQSYDSC